MKKFKIFLTILIITLVVVISIQNKQEVETKILFTTITMPHVLLLLSTFALGYIGGLITTSIFRRKSGKSKG